MRARTAIACWSATVITGCALAQHGPPASEGQEPLNWAEQEKGILENHVQLTFPDRFVKAGESYFSPDDSMVIFQGVEVTDDPDAPVERPYAMFVSDVVRDGTGRITGLADVRRISPPGSSNTCGWFHPTDEDVVYFATTVTTPADETPPGFERLGKRYRWMFPPEMRVVRCRLGTADGTPDSLELVAGDERNYQAEGSLTRDGRTLLYCSLESNQGDIFVKDLPSGAVTRLVGAFGYDGGPFFAPDERRICYRSDRRGDHYLQLFVSELAFDDAGRPVGVAREFQLSDNGAVNWCPYWHPGGRHLVYASSAVGHHNYEVFIVDADPGTLPGSDGTTRYGTAKRRLTHADGADVLPVFNSDGSVMMWTAERDETRTSQLWAADFVLEVAPEKPAE